MNFHGVGSACEQLSLGKESASFVNSLAQGVNLVKEGTSFYSGLLLGCEEWLQDSLKLGRCL